MLHISLTPATPVPRVLPQPALMATSLEIVPATLTGIFQEPWLGCGGGNDRRVFVISEAGWSVSAAARRAVPPEIVERSRSPTRHSATRLLPPALHRRRRAAQPVCLRSLSFLGLYSSRAKNRGALPSFEGSKAGFNRPEKPIQESLW
ncbi:hypothetical protein J6590_052425 [Homalodisca vitripennis]|nr:hypothetical protein J6590_052425 [Homalodisca vitripennis]